MELSEREQEIIEMVIAELRQAKEKHPEWPKDLIHCSAIVGEESGELIQAALQHKYENGSLSHIEEEAVQTAAMAIRLLVNMQV